MVFVPSRIWCKVFVMSYRMISFSVGPAQLVYCTSHLPPRIFTDRPELASEMKLRLLMLFFATALAPKNATWVINVFYPQCLMDVAQNHGKWMCTAPKHDQICSSKACVANIPEVGIRTFRHLSSMWLQFARRIDQSWWMQQNLNLKTTRLSFFFFFFEVFQSQFGVFIALFIIDLVLGSSRVAGSHCNATNSFDGGHWVFLGIHMAIWCPEMSLYIDSIWFHATPMPLRCS